MLRRLSVLLPAFLCGCIIIALWSVVTNFYIGAIPLFIGGSLLGPLTVIFYYLSDKPRWFLALIILTFLLIAMLLAHPIKLTRWSAIVTVIGVLIWMGMGLAGLLAILTAMAT